MYPKEFVRGAWTSRTLWGAFDGRRVSSVRQIEERARKNDIASAPEFPATTYMRHTVRISHATPWHGPWRIITPIKKKEGTYCCWSIAHQVHKYLRVPGTTSYQHSVYLVLLYWVFVLYIPVRTGDITSCWERCRCCSQCKYTHAGWWCICSNRNIDCHGTW